jgi:hypothetical protein
MPIQTAADSISNSAGSPYGFKNRIINGAISISQRTATGTAVAVLNGAGGNFGPDRWWGYTGTLSLWNMYQVSTGNLDFPYAWRTQRIAGQTSTSASYFGQTIETINCSDLAGQTVTISFYATAGANYSGGAATIQLLTGTAADQGTSSLNQALWTGLALPINTTFTPTTTRTRFSFTANVGGNVQEMMLRFNWSGSGTAGAADYIDFTGFQVEEGSVATSFDYRPYGTELSLCHRYFYQSEHFGTNSVSLVSNDFLVYGAYGSTNEWMFAKSKYPVKMRGVGPTALSTSDAAGNIGKLTIMTSTGGVTVNNVTPYTVYSNSDGYNVSIYSEAKYGFFGAIRASAEL